MNKVVVRTAQGEVLKGYTGDFSRHRSSFLLTIEDGAIRINQNIEMKDLKAIFFVKTFEGNFLHKTMNYFKGDTSYGKKVLVTFKDGEKFYGRVEGMHSDPEHIGFFIFPLDTNSNTIRAFVINNFIDDIQSMDLEPDSLLSGD
ncbi:MAG: hypothetical protein K8S62_03315 [Candidatus Sabulitectum sp.]|nr:hypothetical protein [Candidatus Sabulitectum sp.]